MSIKFGDKDYALVPDRLKKFREENPRAAIDTAPTYNVDGSVTFTATIIKDQSDPHSARATGHARYSEMELKKPKSFEKLETVSVGRALANLGYLNDGQIATSEEMEEYEEYKLGQALEAIATATKRDEFQTILASLTPAQKLEATPMINERIKELKEAVNAPAHS
jgi:hypothetical protein